MPITTVGMDQVVLQLIWIHQESHGRQPVGVTDLWKPIFELMLTNEEAARFFSSYQLTEHSDCNPSQQFLGDVREVLQSGFAKLEEGRLSTTSIGYCLAAARELPKRIQMLGDFLEKV